MPTQDTGSTLLPLSTLAEGVGLLQSLTPARLDAAVEMLRDYSRPGTRYQDGHLVYSAAFLGDDVVTGQEVLPL